MELVNDTFHIAVNLMNQYFKVFQGMYICMHKMYAMALNKWVGSNAHTYVIIIYSGIMSPRGRYSWLESHHSL